MLLWFWKHTKCCRPACDRKEVSHWIFCPSMPCSPSLAVEGCPPCLAPWFPFKNFLLTSSQQRNTFSPWGQPVPVPTKAFPSLYRGSAPCLASQFLPVCTGGKMTPGLCGRPRPAQRRTWSTQPLPFQAVSTLIFPSFLLEVWGPDFQATRTANLVDWYDVSS